MQTSNSSELKSGPIDLPSLNNDDIIRRLIRRQIELNSLLEITQAINSNFSAASLFRMFEFILKIHLGIGKLCLFINDNGVWTKATSYGFDEHSSGKSEQQDTQDLEKYDEITYFDGGSGLFMNEFELIIPVHHKKVPLAYVLVGGYDKVLDGTDSDVKFIQTITNIIVVAIENKKLFKEQLEQERLKRELELASQVQTMLFPTILPFNDKVQLAATYLPHHNIGGDYYDYVDLNDDEFVYCIADVSGKGISAALLMSNFQANLRTLVQIHDNLPDLVKALNEKVFSNTRGERFITLFIAKYNVKTRRLTYLNAGHNPPILYSEGEVAQLKEGTTILGIFDELPFIQSGERILEPGTLIINYTDGLTELANADDFDSDKLAEFVVNNNKLDVQEFNDLLLEKLNNYKEKDQFADDVTLLSFRCF